MGYEDGRMSLVKPRLWLLGLFRLLLVWVTAGHGKNMQKEGLEWIWGHSKLPRSSMPSGGGQRGRSCQECLSTPSPLTP